MMNDLTPELDRRRRAAWGAYRSIEDVVKKTRNTRLRAHLFNTTVLPALTYASETWAFRKQEENAVNVASFKLRPRARHVYSEALRVHLFEEACKAGDLIEMGKLMYASHESCSKDYECSCEAMDTLVSECQRAGAIGCRLTGAGWGGCAVALVDNSNPKDLGHKVLFYSKPSAGISGQFL
ncbi:hypothetical protein RB195_006393 [Necator americanus]|uniref:GHMP kinase C-terminal domain-containing protein n=1 Tax=Necator americanus TaxID=51031 RepID=A0ABR1BVZ0_NECAM